MIHDVSPGHVPDIDAPHERTFDVFVSHASKDKKVVVEPLTTALRDAGLRVWYDDFQLQIGDSLRRRIDKGVRNSRFGLVVLSPAFFGREWPEYELDGLVINNLRDAQNLLPIWHNVTEVEVLKYSPWLAGLVARSTATHTVKQIAEEIVGVIRNSTSSSAAFR